MNLEILKIASDTTNFKKLNKYTHSAKYKNSMCGDEITVKININNKIIDKIGYEGNFCVYCQASAETLARIFTKKEKNFIVSSLKSLIEIDNLKSLEKNKNFGKVFNIKNIKRKKCIYLPVNALIKALRINI